MSTTIRIDNYTSLNVKERTFLTASVLAGVTTLPLQSNQNFATNDFSLIGQQGSERSELRAILTIPDATSVTIAASTFNHLITDPIVALFGNKIRIYRALNATGVQPADGDFSPISTIDIDPDEGATTYTDPDGSSSYWYKFTYFNSLTLSETSLAESGAARGGGIGQYCTLDSIRQAAGFEHNKNLLDSLISEKRSAAQDYMNGRLAGIYTLPFVAPINAHIANIARLLAAGYLRKDQYGETDARGKAMLDEAEGYLAKLVSGATSLVDEAGQTSAAATGMGFSGYPNGETEDQYGNGGPMFTMASVQNNTSRLY